MMVQQKEQLVQFARKLITNRLTTGSGGNISVIDRQNNCIAVTPSGMDYFEMTCEDIVLCDRQGRVMEGRCSPSSEMAFHLALYDHRPDIGSVVHTHSVYATTLACMQREIPAVHYLVGFSGHKVPLAPYATFGTPELARSVTDTIGTFNAVLWPIMVWWPLAKICRAPSRQPKKSNLSPGYTIRLSLWENHRFYPPDKWKTY